MILEKSVLIYNEIMNRLQSFMFKYCFKFIKKECTERVIKLLDPYNSGYTIIRCEKVTNEQIRDIITKAE